MQYQQRLEDVARMNSHLQQATEEQRQQHFQNVAELRQTISSNEGNLQQMNMELQDFGQRLAKTEGQIAMGMSHAGEVAPPAPQAAGAASVEDLSNRLVNIERNMLYAQTAPQPVLAVPSTGMSTPVMTPQITPQQPAFPMEATGRAPSPSPSQAFPPGAGADNPEEIDCLVNKVAEAETECTRIQLQLQDRIATMDKMLENMASNIFRPMSDSLAPTHALTDLAYSPANAAAAAAIGRSPVHSSPGVPPPMTPQPQGPVTTIMEPVTPQAGSGRLYAGPPPTYGTPCAAPCVAPCVAPCAAPTYAEQDSRTQMRLPTPRAEDSNQRSLSPSPAGYTGFGR